jgi:hypothetical protein
MVNHPNRTLVAQARSAAKAAGYYIREGEYHGTTDNRIGRWYIGHNDDDWFRPYGAGYGSEREAWMAAAEAAAQAA